MGRPPVGRRARTGPSPAHLKTKGTRQNFRENKGAVFRVNPLIPAMAQAPPRGATFALAHYLVV